VLVGSEFLDDEPAVGSGAEKRENAMKPGSIIGVFVAAMFAMPAANAATHIVTNAGNTFTPANITIAVGDTVEWQWGGGSHTVTSGTGIADPNFGNMFNAPWNAANPTFSFTYNSAGVFPYFCIPHEGLGMVGTVEVTSGAVNVPTLSEWGMIAMGIVLLGGGAFSIWRRML
jgi:plastocyanin